MPKAQALSNFAPGVSIRNSGMGPWTPDFDPFLHTGIFEDFHEYRSGDWTLTETQAGATQALAAGHGGILALVNSAASGDVNSLQRSALSLAFAAGRKAWMGFRAKVDDATNAAFLLGLAAVDTSPIASLPSDFAAFYKPSGAATLDFRTAASSAALVTQSAIATLANDTYYTMEMFYDGLSEISLYVNGLQVSGPSPAAFAALLPTANLELTLALQNGTAAARTMSVDYALAYMDR